MRPDCPAFVNVEARVTSRFFLHNKGSVRLTVRESADVAAPYFLESIIDRY